MNLTIFQSTQPEWAATVFLVLSLIFWAISIHAAQEGCDVNTAGRFNKKKFISIHAAQEGCDLDKRKSSTVAFYFNPRSPRGLRPKPVSVCHQGYSHFNPRSPRGLRLADRRKCFRTNQDFNPRSPRGLRQFNSSPRSVPLPFQSTQPKRAATSETQGNGMGGFYISIHAAQEGCDYHLSSTPTLAIYFNPRSPRGLRLI